MNASSNERKRTRTDAEDIDPASFEDRDNGAVQSTKRARVEERRSLFVRSLPLSATSESLTGFFSEHFPVKHAVVVMDQKTKESRGYGFVTFADADDAKEAKEKLDKQEWDGRRIRIDVAEPRHRNAADGAGEAPVGKPKKEEFQKPPKLIVRNLPWSIKTSDQLSNLFRSFGKVKFADLPQSKGKLKGFGFVTIRGKKNAERALDAINGKEIDGRTVAVDWAVDKESWEQQKPEENDESEEKGDEEDVEQDADSGTSEDEDEEGGAKSRDSELDADLENFMKNHMQNMEDEDEDKEDDDDEAENTEKATRKKTTDNTATVFVRNLPFTATDEQLKDFFAHFGKVRYARVVFEKISGNSAGTGFVCFYDIEDAKNCIKGAPRPRESVVAAKTSILQDESADPDGKYTLDGRLLQVAQAVSKDQATTLAEGSMAKRNQKDKRRLFLLNEGAIDRSSPLFGLLSQSEVQTRQASAAQRKKLVEKNPSLHVSLTRLALRNIPRNIGAKELKELGRKAVVGFAKDVKEGRRQPLSKEENARDGKDAKEKEYERKLKGKGIIRQAKIIFESTKGTKVQEKEGGKSRGYGFIEYTSHHWALMGLRYLNGHQLENESGKKQRLIVEFSIENAQVVQRRRTNEEKSRQPQKDEQSQGRPSSGKPYAQSNKGSRENGFKDKGNGRHRKGGEAERAEHTEQVEKPKDAKEAMQQRLIARKRLVRKKKSQSRSKN